VSAPLQAFIFSSYLLNVVLQLANKNGIQNKKKKRSYISLSDNYFFSFSCRAPSLVRGLVCNLQCNHANSSSSYIATDGQ
jgi:hypothetical protein